MVGMFSNDPRLADVPSPAWTGMARPTGTTRIALGEHEKPDVRTVAGAAGDDGRLHAENLAARV
jgi:hypothetical protein